MKIVIGCGLWFFGYLISVFLLMLLLRLMGESPEAVYDFDADAMGIYMLMLILWPVALAIEVLYFTYKFINKFFVLGVESIIVMKEIKEESEKEKNESSNN